jgi:hypothetical protein
MLKIFSIEANTVAIESEGDSITFDVSKCYQFQVGKKLFHDDSGATVHVAECLSKMLAAFGVDVELPDVPKLSDPVGVKKGE